MWGTNREVGQSLSMVILAFCGRACFNFNAFIGDLFSLDVSIL